MKHGKKYQDSVKLIDHLNQYDPDQACDLVIKTGKAKFDETIDTALFRTMKRHRRYCHLINRKRRMRAYGKDLHLY